MKNSIRFSQNFLHSPNLVKKLLDKTNITSQDIVYDIGSGKGIMAAALAPRSHTVIAVEIDPKLAAKLRNNLSSPNVLVYQGDFLSMPLPRTSYKVFANLPYNLSADILHKLVDSKNPPLASYLIVQKEFANKLISKIAMPNSQLAILIGVRFKVRVLQELNPLNFYPRPKVNSVFLEMLRRPEALIKRENLPIFRNFIVFTYNSFKPTISDTLLPLFSKKEFAQLALDLKFSARAIPTQLNLTQWLKLFEAGLKKRAKLEALVENYEAVLAKKHAKREKIHRTKYSKYRNEVSH